MGTPQRRSPTFINTSLLNETTIKQSDKVLSFRTLCRGNDEIQQGQHIISKNSLVDKIILKDCA